MPIRANRNDVLADLIVHLLEKFLLNIRILFQKDINDVILQDPYTKRPVNCHAVLIIVLQVIFLLLFDVAGYIFRDVADIDGAVYVLLYQYWFCACEVLHLDTILQCLIGRLNSPPEVIYFSEAFRGELVFRQIGGKDLVFRMLIVQSHPYHS